MSIKDLELVIGNIVNHINKLIFNDGPVFKEKLMPEAKKLSGFSKRWEHEKSKLLKQLSEAEVNSGKLLTELADKTQIYHKEIENIYYRGKDHIIDSKWLRKNKLEKIDQRTEVTNPTPNSSEKLWKYFHFELNTSKELLNKILKIDQHPLEKITSNKVLFTILSGCLTFFIGYFFMRLLYPNIEIIAMPYSSIRFVIITLIIIPLIVCILLYPMIKFYIASLASKLFNQFCEEIKLSRLILNKILNIEKLAIESKLSVEKTNYKDKLNSVDKILEIKNSLQKKIDEIKKLIDYLTYESDRIGVEWGDSKWNRWVPSANDLQLVRIGTAIPDFSSISDLISEVNLENEIKQLSFQVFLSFTSGLSTVFLSNTSCMPYAIMSVQNIMLRLLTVIPPGKLKFTLIDPVGLGQNFSNFMHLADYDESLIDKKVWTEPSQIAKRLAELTEHIENVIQKYLRSDFKTIEDYNKKAEEIAEPYRVVIVMDYPTNFNDDAVRRLCSITDNGPRCGVYVIAVSDPSKLEKFKSSMTNPNELLQKNIIMFKMKEYPDKTYVETSYKDLGSHKIVMDSAPSNDMYMKIIRTVGPVAKTNTKVEVPFEKMLSISGIPANIKDSWAKFNTIDNLEIPVGRTGANKLQYLIFGSGMEHHALVVGRTGSGKSNLMHIIITSLAIKYSPDEIELYLIDFKKGIEFKLYAEHKLPHIKVVAIESEIEFGLSVLEGLNKELTDRGEIFRNSIVGNISEYKRKKTGRMPRILLLIDEFQEFFVRQDKFSSQAGLILDRLVRQGRSFGIHLLLGSQTLAGSYSLPKSTIEQMAIRIALQCSDNDSRIILADDNPAARLLSRSGEAIYNSASGLIEGNNLFQIALFSENDRDKYLNFITKFAAEDDKKWSFPIVFEGYKSVQIDLCKPLNDLLSSSKLPEKQNLIELYLGEPVAILPPVSAKFRHQSGKNLLIISKEESQCVGLTISSIISILAQHKPEDVKIYIYDLSTPDSPWSEFINEINDLFPHKIKQILRKDFLNILEEITEIIKKRIDDEKRGKPYNIYLIIEGLHKARDLRQDEKDYKYGSRDVKTKSHAELFATIVREGPEFGVHVISWCDTYSNITKIIDRRVLREFGVRATGTMTSEDSMNFLNDPCASKIDKPHRMIFYDEDNPSNYVKFRPYSIPERSWLSKIGQNKKYSGYKRTSESEEQEIVPGGSSSTDKKNTCPKCNYQLNTGSVISVFCEKCGCKVLLKTPSRRA